MADSSPIDPNSSVPPPGTPEASKAPNVPMPMTGSYQYQPMTFLGMQFDAQQTKQLWESILQGVNAQIAKDKKKAIKAIRNFGKSPGDPDYEI